MRHRGKRAAFLASRVVAAVLGSVFASSTTDGAPCGTPAPGARPPVELAGGLECSACPRLALVFSDPGHALPFPSERLAREVAELFARLNVQVGWRSLQAGDATEHEILVVLLDREPPGRINPRAMGMTNPSAGTRAVWLMLPNVKRTVGLDGVPGRTYGWFPPPLFARALARVVAHEILHILAPANPHASRGLMSASLTRPQLVADDLEVDAASRFALGAAFGCPQASAATPATGWPTKEEGVTAREPHSPGE